METLKLTWTQHSTYSNHKSELGFAQVEEIIPGKWRWEAYSNNQLQSLDMDCWWGTSPSLEQAQLEAEQELARWAR